MAACRSVRGAAFVFSMVLWSFAQEIPQHPAQPVAPVPGTVPLEVISTVLVPSLSSLSMALPVLCSPEDTIVAQFATGDGLEDPVSVSSDGKTVIRFGREKINDIQQPIPFEVFLRDAGVYILTPGHIPLGYETKWRAPTGEVEHHQASTNRTFVAHFQRDGSYSGAVLLDVPFKPMHLGVFADGDFLIAGADKMTDEPRVAIVGSNGQFRRFVELKGDVHLRSESDAPGKDQDPTALPRFAPGEDFGESLRDVLFTSQIIGDGPNLLLFRPGNGPVFSISPGGEVRVQNLKVQGDHRLYAIKPTRDSWIVEFTHHLSDGTGEVFAIYAFDPGTGAPLRQYIFPRDLGFGLACTDGVEFTFVMADTEGKGLKLLKLAPSTARAE